MSIFDKGKGEEYDKLLKQELEMARYVRDIIGKNEDTRKVFEVAVGLLQAGESRVLLDMAEGRSPAGEKYTEADFRERVGEVAGMRWLPMKVRSLIKKADEADMTA